MPPRIAIEQAVDRESQLAIQPVQQTTHATGRLARSLGERRPFWRVVLPLSRPAIAAGMGMIMMDSLGEYGAVRAEAIDILPMIEDRG